MLNLSPCRGFIVNDERGIVTLHGDFFGETICDQNRDAGMNFDFGHGILSVIANIVGVGPLKSKVLTIFAQAI